MKTIYALAFLHSCLAFAAEPQSLFFAAETAEDSTRIALTIEGDQVYGSQSWQPKAEAHGASGSLTGTIADGLIKVVYEYTIEGSTQSEDQLLKLDGDKLYIGDGELIEGKDGRLKLKEPKKVTFTKALNKVPVAEPKVGTPERKAIMDAMRGPVSAEIGKPITFTGDVRISGHWARFTGNVATKDGIAPKDEDEAFQLELDFFALLKKDPEGVWQVLESGFAGDIGVREAARERFTKAPWVLFE
jgi:hypothetical protein